MLRFMEKWRVTNSLLILANDETSVPLEENRRLLSASRSANLQGMSESLARGADINYADLDDPDHTTPLHAAIVSVSALESGLRALCFHRAYPKAAVW